MSDLHSIEAEQALLGALLLNNDVIRQCPATEPAHFFEPLHGRVFDLIREKINAGALASPVTLRFAMQDDPGLTALGGPAYLARMAGAAVALHAAGDYAAMIRDLWARREMTAAVGQAIVRLERGDGGCIEEIAAELSGAVATVIEAGGAKPLSRSWLRAVTEAVQETADAYQNDRPPGVSWGLRTLDDAVGTLMPGRIYVMAARPSMGKTSVAETIAIKVAQAGTPVAFASLEMLDTDLARRGLSQMLRASGMRTPYFKLERGQVTEGEMRRTIEVAQEHSALPLHFIGRDHCELSRLGLACRALRRSKEIGLIVVDYLQLVQVDGARSTFDRVSAVSKGLKRLAMDLKVPVIALCQLSRAVEDRDDKRPRLSDLRASGEIEEDADVVMGLYRDGYYSDREKPGSGQSKALEEWYAREARAQNRLDVLALKVRGGAVGTVSLRCELEHNWVEDWPAQEVLGF